MRIKNFSLNSNEEVVVKIVNEVLNLFKIECISETEEKSYDYAKMAIENVAKFNEENVELITKVILQDKKHEEVFQEKKISQLGEKLKAAERRLIKLNLYDILLKVTNEKPAPWGIMHGVRPTKIVHKYIDCGMKMIEIVRELENNYYVSNEKANLITKLAFRQLPFLKTSSQRTVSIYIGIPFCLTRCLYCSFPAYVLPESDILQEFLFVLKKDIAAVKKSIEDNRLIVQNIYIGGGTPTSLPEKIFAELLDLVKKSFFSKNTVEFTVEAGRPDSVNDDKITSMVQCKVNRVSVNPQTMQQKTLKRIGRNHTVEDIIELFYKFRQVGMRNINMDVIIGLPGEDNRDVEDTMQQISKLNPDNITIHALALKKGSRLKLNREIYTLPSDETVKEMFATAMQYANRLGMEPYYLYRQGYMSGNLENIGYSKCGAEGLYNIQIMEERQTIIGVGPAATTKVVNTKDWSLQTSFNAKDLTTYLMSVDKYIERRTNLINRAFGNREE